MPNKQDRNTVTNYKYLGQTIAMENRTRQEVLKIIKAMLLEKYRDTFFLDRHLPINLKRKVFNQCALPAMIYGCQTWFLIKALVKKWKKGQRSTKRKMLNVKLKRQIP